MEPHTDNSKNKVLNIFDKVLIKHLKRLIDTTHGINIETINSLIISCLILLLERENEIECFPSDSSSRYTPETLTSELEEMGFGPDSDMNIVVQDMIENGYINIDDESFIPEEPAKTMVKLLDQIFPGMPGMNLVAYFIQTMDEVKSERKDLDSAIDQFDQMLNMQGVPLNKEQPDSKPPKLSERSEEQNTQIKKSGILGRQKTDNWHKDSKISPSAPKVLSSSSYKGKVRKLDFGKPFPEEDEIDKITPDADNHIESEEPETIVKVVETKPHDEVEPTNIETSLETSSKQSTDADIDVQSLTEETAATNIPSDDSTYSIETTLQDNKPVEPNNDQFIKKNIAEAKEAMIDEPDTSSEKDDSHRTNDSIEDQIAAFEEGLALECPVCRQSKVRAEETGMGKSYYKCLNKNCNFISWGKPYHILCPQCNSPFLVEASDRAGKIILKCPRSTCRHWQPPPWEAADNTNGKINSVSHGTKKVTSISKKPRKRVKKRRVVRRKK